MYEIFSESICLSWFAMLQEIWAPAKLHSRIKQRIKQLVFFMHHTLIPCRVQLLKSIVISYFHFNQQRKCGTPHSFNWRFWQNPNKKNEWNSTLCIGVCRAVAVRQKGVPVRAGVDTQEKSAVRGFLIRWKTVRFSIENRVIAHFVFYAESLRPRKVNKNFGSLKTALWIFCIFVSSIWIVM